jgi:hypothetical protein
MPYDSLDRGKSYREHGHRPQADRGSLQNVHLGKSDGTVLPGIGQVSRKHGTEHSPATHHRTGPPSTLDRSRLFEQRIQIVADDSFAVSPVWFESQLALQRVSARLRFDHPRILFHVTPQRGQADVDSNRFAAGRRITDRRIRIFKLLRHRFPASLRRATFEIPPRRISTTLIALFTVKSVPRFFYRTPIRLADWGGNSTRRNDDRSVSGTIR